MNREQARKAAEVMQAYAEGKAIEFRWVGDGPNGAWQQSILELVFNWEEAEYRVAPEKMKVDVWINIYPLKTPMRPQIHFSKQDADEAASRNRIACKHLVFEFEKGEGL